MKMFKWIQIFLLLFPATTSVLAQTYSTYQTAGATILEVNGNTRNEYRLEGVTVSLSNNSHLLIVRLSIPLQSIHYIPGDTSFPGFGLPCNLEININSWQIQADLTSTKTFVTRGILLLNHISRSVRVEYMPLPDGTDEDGNFNVSMFIQFNPRDFDLDERHESSLYIIKISDATVNRI